MANVVKDFTLEWEVPADSPYPLEHLEDAEKLEADGVVWLFQIHLRPSGILYLKTHDQVTWQGNTYEPIAIRLTGVGQNVEDRKNRPQLQIANPDGVFSAVVRDKKLDYATVVRYRVLREHIDTDQPIYTRQQWLLTRVAGLNNRMITCELRDMMDGPNFKIPARVFMPPEFPLVNLK